MVANLQRCAATWSPFRAAHPARSPCVTVTAVARRPSKQQKDGNDVVVQRLDRRELLVSVGAAVALSTGNSAARAEVQVGSSAEVAPASSRPAAFARAVCSIFQQLAAIQYHLDAFFVQSQRRIMRDCMHQNGTHVSERHCCGVRTS